MPVCAIKLCRNYSKRLRTDKDVTYHRVPYDPILRSRWIDIIRKSRGEGCWQPAKYSYMCSDHFRPKEFYYANKQARRRLIKDSIPSKALFLSSKKSESENSDEYSVNTIENFEDDKNLVPVKCLEINDEPLSFNKESCKEPAFIEINIEEYSDPNAGDSQVKTHADKDPDMSEDWSDLESIFDSPSETKMRRELRRRIELQKKHTLIIQSLKRVNLRLRRKVATLERLNASLKKNQIN